MEDEKTDAVDHGGPVMESLRTYVTKSGQLMLDIDTNALDHLEAFLGSEGAKEAMGGHPRGRHSSRNESAARSAGNKSAGNKKRENVENVVDHLRSLNHVI